MLLEAERIRRSPGLFIVDTTEEQINKIDVKREQEIQALDEFYGQMIDRLETLFALFREAECSAAYYLL